MTWPRRFPLSENDHDLSFCLSWKALIRFAEILRASTTFFSAFFECLLISAGVILKLFVVRESKAFVYLRRALLPLILTSSSIALTLCSISGLPPDARSLRSLRKPPTSFLLFRIFTRVNSNVLGGDYSRLLTSLFLICNIQNICHSSLSGIFLKRRILAPASRRGDRTSQNDRIDISVLSSLQLLL